MRPLLRGLCTHVSVECTVVLLQAVGCVVLVLLGWWLHLADVDFVLPSRVKSCSAVFAELIAELANHCFHDGCFPACFKHAAITPLLKKPTLEKSDPSSYWPISNLDFITKISERLFLARFQSQFSIQISIVTSLPIGPGTQLKLPYLRHSIQSTVHPTLAHLPCSCL